MNLQEIIEQLKSEFKRQFDISPLCLVSDKVIDDLKETIFNDYQIAIPEALFTQKVNRDMLNVIYLLSDLPFTSNYFKVHLLTRQTYSQTNIMQIVNSHFPFTNSDLILVNRKEQFIFILNETEDNRINVRFCTVSIRVDAVNRRLQTRFDNIVIPTQCLIPSNTQFQQVELPHMNFNHNFYDLLDRKYKLTMNNNELHTTNEITNKTKIYSIMDKNVLRTLGNLKNTRKIDNVNCRFLNPNLSYFFTSITKEIPINHLFALFDINEKEFLKTFKAVTYITNPIYCLGLGGLMSNFLFWCQRIQNYFDLPYTFKKLKVYEPDNLEFDNLFRIPLNWKDIKIPTGNYQNHFLDKVWQMTENSARLSKLLLMHTTDIAQDLELHYTMFDGNYERLLKGAILIGGVDLNSRLEIFNKWGRTNSDITFICPTHSNDTLRIDFYPNFNHEVLIETYGSVDLNKFLLTMFKMTIELLKVLANKSYDNEDNTKKLDVNHLTYTLADTDFKANSQKYKCLKDVCYIFN